MFFRKDYEFFEVVLGVIAIFIPIIVIVSLSTDEVYSRTALLGFSIASIVAGLVAGLLILDGYYKLTEKLKFLEFEDYKESKEKGI